MDILMSKEMECLKKEAYCRSFIESTSDELNAIILKEEVDRLICEAGGDSVGPPPGTLASEGLLIKVINAIKKIIMMTVEYVKDVLEKINTYFTGLKINKITDTIKKLSAEDKAFANTKITIPDYTFAVKKYDGLFAKAGGLFSRAVSTNGVLSDSDNAILEQIKDETDTVEVASSKYSKVITIGVAVATLAAVYAILKDVPSQLAEKAQEMHRLALAGNPQPIINVTQMMTSIRRSESRFLHNIIKKIYDELRYQITGYGDIARPRGMTPSKFLNNNRKYYPHSPSGKAFESYDDTSDTPMGGEVSSFEEAYNSILNSLE